MNPIHETSVFINILVCSYPTDSLLRIVYGIIPYKLNIVKITLESRYSNGKNLTKRSFLPRANNNVKKISKTFMKHTKTQKKLLPFVPQNANLAKFTAKKSKLGKGASFTISMFYLLI